MIKIMTGAVSRRRFPAVAQPQLGWLDHMVTTLLGTWLLIGLFVDGWAHQNLSELETFFTPWHGVFYSGFLASAAWNGWLALRDRGAAPGSIVVPLGYGLGLIGLAIFAAGGVGDMLWHEAFGIEAGIDALLSPTHLVLLTGAMLFLSSPLRALWLGGDPARDARSLWTFLPVMLSLTLVLTLVLFFLTYASAFVHVGMLGEGISASTSPEGAERTGHLAQEVGLGSILVTNVVLVAPMLLALRRWLLPFGSVAMLFTVPAVLSAGLLEFSYAFVVPAALLAGLLADVLIRVLRPSPQRLPALRLFAALVPTILWGGYVLSAALAGALQWSLELSAGIAVLTGMGGYGLSILTTPPVAGGEPPERR